MRNTEHETVRVSGQGTYSNKHNERTHMPLSDFAFPRTHTHTHTQTHTHTHTLSPYGNPRSKAISPFHTQHRAALLYFAWS